MLCIVSGVHSSCLLFLFALCVIDISISYVSFLFSFARCIRIRVRFAFSTRIAASFIYLINNPMHMHAQRNHPPKLPFPSQSVSLIVGFLALYVQMCMFGLPNERNGMYGFIASFQIAFGRSFMERCGLP